MADINSNDGPPSPPHSPPLNNDDPMDIDDDTVTSDELEIDITDFHMRRRSILHRYTVRV